MNARAGAAVSLLFLGGCSGGEAPDDASAGPSPFALQERDGASAGGASRAPERVPCPACGADGFSDLQCLECIVATERDPIEDYGAGGFVLRSGGPCRECGGSGYVNCEFCVDGRPLSPYPEADEICWHCRGTRQRACARCSRSLYHYLDDELGTGEEP